MIFQLTVVDTFLPRSVRKGSLKSFTYNQFLGKKSDMESLCPQTKKEVSKIFLMIIAPNADKN
jgi:hypothetical protein